MSTLWWILTIVTLGYLLPSAIASTRKAKNSGMIQLLNIFGGWTGVGYFAALLWAIFDQPQDPSGGP